MFDQYRSINVIVGPVDEIDVDLFGLFVNNTFEETHFLDVDNMANLLKEVGVFESTSKARNAGWNKPIPIGYSEFFFKNYRNVHILRYGEFLGVRSRRERVHYKFRVLKRYILRKLGV